MNPTEIAEWTQTERHNISALMKRMLKEGLITYERDQYDQRRVIVTITTKGREVLRQAMPVAVELAGQAMLSVNELHAGLLEVLLRKLRQNAHSGLTRVTNFPIREIPEDAVWK